MKPQFRKVQLINDSSFAIVIPKDMANEMKIEKGDNVKIQYIEDTKMLVITDTLMEGN